ncbi:MAG: hypothetical protein AAF357_14475, partial [Verrucomicrobiota bacterium]
MAWFAITVIICLWHENKWIQIHLSDEVSNGVIHAEQALDAARYWTRSSLAIFSRGFSVLKRRSLFHEATELAFEKQRQLRFGASDSCTQRLDLLRSRVRHLSQKDPEVLAGHIKPGKLLPPPLPPTRRVPPAISQGIG